MSTEHFIPPGSQTTELPHEIIALVGLPGSGKTTSAATFPNRIWLDFDHKLPQGEVAIPFWDSKFVDSLAKRTSASSPANQRDAFKKWLRENHLKFAPDQTLIIDSWSNMMNGFNIQTYVEDSLLAKPNPFWFWKQKGQFCEEIVTYIKSCPCRVIVTFHEAIDRDEEGTPNGKIRPLMDGSFKDQLLGHFTDAWHQVCNPPKLDAQGRRVVENNKYVIEPGYFWELTASPVFNVNTNPILGKAIRAKGITKVPANYAEIERLYATTA